MGIHEFWCDRCDSMKPKDQYNIVTFEHPDKDKDNAYTGKYNLCDKCFKTVHATLMTKN